MKKNIVAIFAHPDDEAFGPAGTLALLAQTHSVYIICVTNGAVGRGEIRRAANVAEIRRRELLGSAEILGVKKVFFLDFHDGSLSNNLYHRIALKIEPILKRIRPETIITFEPRGVTGHIDHVVVSFVSSYLFERMPFIKNIHYYCLLKKNQKKKNKYFIYVPPGYADTEVGKTVAIAPVFDKKIRAIKRHQSQKHDIIRILPVVARGEKKEHFLVLKKRG
ncbi:MAG: hypothetical protein A2934_04150 [Candidatus Sungbacteria bacterium RIFCSPLOWO2_01_FULL_47_10]|uniref:GlcNAc-PI de-N-acetylase n=1 Tax=Candidatus Sungbacteria bacterium RIFCSPLOWO2_01_FULL_47_10 TaxID=1802276 RepID=A0A1G2L163_9BACT|nr:MAG: hypothetical protein A2934_04150 [Candidatus Sungbacteria bacterium RIFCSPLOWO2_01_FULL_47_10]